LIDYRIRHYHFLDPSDRVEDLDFEVPFHRKEDVVLVGIVERYEIPNVLLIHDFEMSLFEPRVYLVSLDAEVAQIVEVLVLGLIVARSPHDCIVRVLHPVEFHLVEVLSLDSSYCQLTQAVYFDDFESHRPFQVAQRDIQKNHRILAEVNLCERIYVPFNVWRHQVQFSSVGMGSRNLFGGLLIRRGNKYFLQARDLLAELRRQPIDLLDVSDLKLLALRQVQFHDVIGIAFLLPARQGVVKFIEKFPLRVLNY
jgi:hypothetical protein